MASRFWRVINLSAYAGGLLTLSALHLYDASGRVDAQATISTSAPILAGAIADLQSASLQSVVTLNSVTPGAAVIWDFGAQAKSVVQLRVGSGTEQDSFLDVCTLQWSDDAMLWTTVSEMGRFAWPGPLALTKDLGELDPSFDKVSLLLKMEGDDGKSKFSDSSTLGNLVTAQNVTTRSARKKFGVSSGYFPGASKLSVPFSAVLRLKDSYCVECWVYPETISGWRNVFTINESPVAQFGSFTFALSNGQLLLEIRPQASAAVKSVQGGTVPANDWTHIAASVDNGLAKLFVNGVQTAGPVNLPNFTFAPVGVAVGANANGYNDSVEGFVGYIDELRIKNGDRVYAGNFPLPGEFAGIGGLSRPVGANSSDGPAVIRSEVSAFAVSAATPHVVDVEDGGLGEIYGLVAREVRNVRTTLGRKVRLHDQRSARLLRESWSDPVTGAYRFTGLKVGPEYCVMAFDHERQNFAVAADGQLAREVQS